MSEKLERLAAQFRLHGTTEQALQIDSWLNTEFSFLMGDTTSAATLGLLPVKQKLSPRLNSWPETQAAMMPARKKRTKRTGDKSYGAGESSGKKAKTTLQSKAANATTMSVPTRSLSTTVTQVSTLSPNAEEREIAPEVQLPASSSYYRPKTHLY